MKIVRLMVKMAIVATTTTVLILFLFSWRFYHVNPLDVTHYMVARIGSTTGTSAEVPENPYNTLAQELREREEELDEREEVLLQTLEERDRENRFISNLILISIVTLFLLVLFNFYLDYRTRKEERVLISN